MAILRILVLAAALLFTQPTSASMSAKEALDQLQEVYFFMGIMDIIDTEISDIRKNMTLPMDVQKFEGLHDMFIGAISKLSNWLTKRSEDVSNILDWLKTRTERTTAEFSAELVTAKTHVLVALHRMQVLIKDVNDGREDLISPVIPDEKQMEVIQVIVGDFDVLYPLKRRQIITILDEALSSIKSHITKYGPA